MPAELENSLEPSHLRRVSLAHTCTCCRHTLCAGSIPKELGAPTKLTSLSLGRNQLSGERMKQVHPIG